MRKRRVVVTGLGVVAPTGIGRDAFWNAVTNGKSGVDLIMSFDTSKLNSRIAAQVLEFDPLNYMSPQVVKKTDRFVHFGLAASRMALEDSRLDLEKEDKSRTGVVIGSVFGGMLFHEAQIISGYQKGINRLNPMCIPRITPNAVTSHIAMEFNITGISIAIASACASGTDAIGQAFRFIQNNDADVIFAGGVEAPLTAFTFSAFSAMRVLSQRNDSPHEASRPFDRERDGFVLGEGGAILIMEELSRAIKRDARIYGEIISYASNCGSYHMVLPEPDGTESAKIMSAAIKEAEIRPEDVDYISAYGNSTKANDKAETKAIKLVFRDDAYNKPVSSIKSMIGHTIGASGAIEAVSCALALEHGMIPPTINYSYPDEECDLDYVPNRARKARINTILSNSFGVGNNNASIIIRRFCERRRMN